MNNASLTIVSEANLGVIDPEKITEFNDIAKGFGIETNTLPNNAVSRVAVFIKHGVEYSRVHSAENTINPSVVIKIYSTKRKYVTIVGWYRQWKCADLTKPVSTHDKEL